MTTVPPPPPGRRGPSPALLTDLYELTMAAALHAEGAAEVPATFSLFVRSLPPDRGYLVAAGLEDVITFLGALSYGEDDLRALDATGLFDDGFLSYLAGLRFTGRVRAVPEGRVVLGSEPFLEVDAPIVQGQLAETALLFNVGHQTTVASKAARLREAAAGRPVSDFGTRSASGADAALRLARSARIAGLDSTSNVAGAALYGLPASGTMAHSFVQAHADEKAAFMAYARRFGPRTVLLVDTYDALNGVRNAISVAQAMREEGVELAGIRTDSGDVASFCRQARRMLDDAGFPDLRIVATGGLDETRIASLIADGVPVDAFGVGSSLAIPRDAPALETTYKLVEVDGRPARKRSPGKESWPGRKQVWRLPEGRGDVLALADEEAPEPGADPVMTEVVVAGARTENDATDVGAAAQRFDRDLSWLPAAARRIARPEAPPVSPSERLADLTVRMAAVSAASPGA